MTVAPHATARSRGTQQARRAPQRELQTAKEESTRKRGFEAKLRGKSLPGFHEILRGLRDGASTKKNTACCWQAWQLTFEPSWAPARNSLDDDAGSMRRARTVLGESSLTSKHHPDQHSGIAASQKFKLQ